DKAILSGADNHPPMLEKNMYDSWKSIIEHYMLNRPNGRMILESVEQGPLIWPTKGETLRDFNLIFSLLLNDMNMYNMKLEQFPVNTKFLNTLPSEWTSYQSSPYDPTYHNSQFVSSRPSSLTHSISYPGTKTSSLVNHDAYLASSSAPQIAYTQMDQQSSPEAGL
nr:hypothetical protein [Tanacetum cinerariifolium]